MFYSGMLYRSTDSNYSYNVGYVPGTKIQRFALKQFFQDRAAPPPFGAVVLGCQDTSNYQRIVWLSLGIPAAGVYLEPAVTSANFRTHPVCPMGSPPAQDANYRWYELEFHQVATDEGSNVTDSALAHYYNLSGQPYRDIPVGWFFSDFWQTATQILRWYPGFPPFYSYYLGLAFRYANSNWPYGEPVGWSVYAVNLIGYIELES